MSRASSASCRLLLTAIVILAACLGAITARPAPAVDAAGSGRFGLVADIGTRHPCDGQQGGPVGVLAATGARWAKEEVRWDWVEPSRDQWTWTCMDRAINDERARGLDILGQLDYTAGWAVGKSDRVVYDPPPLDLWQNYVIQTVSRYKDRIHAWEVWNEPNNPVFWTGSRDQYMALLVVTHDAIKQADPSALVVGPAITGVDTDWLNAMPWDKIDVLGLHMYVPPAFLNDQGYSYFNQGLPNLAQIVSQHGNKPIWLTELGYSSQSGPDPWHVGDEGLQARYLAEFLAETTAFVGLNIERLLPYDFNDDTPGGGFGLTRNDWSSQKPAFAAFHTLVGQLDGATGQGRANLGAGVFAFQFSRNGQTTLVVWSANNTTVTIPSAGDGTVTDLYGKQQTVTRQNGALHVPVGADPVYIVYQAGGGGNASIVRFSQHQQQTFANHAQLLALNAQFFAVLNAKCAQSCPKFTTLFQYSSAIQALLSLYYFQLANGVPPGSAQLRAMYEGLDSGDYTELAKATPPPTPNISTNLGMSDAEANAANALLSNQAQQLGTAQAIDTSLGRADAAQAAGDDNWEGQQLQNAQQLSSQQAALSEAEPALLDNMQAAAQASGDNESLSANDVASYQNDIAQNDLSPAYNQTLHDLGASPTMQADVHQQFSAQDAGAVAALGGGQFPQLLTTPQLTSDLQLTAQALRDFSTSQCFPTTGYCVSARFVAYWNAHGGLAIYGYPLSEEFNQQLADGHTYAVQYFERARFEWHPENQPPYDVLLGQFGRIIHPADPPVAPQDGAQYFDVTGHNVSPAFFAYWQTNGGLAQFGYPLSEAFTETLANGQPYTVQYFERARFELHPENQPPYNILLGQFGRQIYATLGR
jgi:hypothetical protein